LTDSEVGDVFDELLLELLFRVWLVFVFPVNLDDLAELGPALSFSGLVDDSHDYIFQQILSQYLL